MASPEKIRPRGLSALRQLARPGGGRPVGQPLRGERCDFCAVLLPEPHGHLIEVATRRIVCACDACALLFDNPAEQKFRRVPRRIRRLVDFQLTDAGWNDLLIPINMAFFFHSTPAERVVAMYPSPAGAVESLLTLESWTSMVADNPILVKMQPDVEALLVNRLQMQPSSLPSPLAGEGIRQAQPSGPGVRGNAPSESTSNYYLAPIDECYKLVGLLRTNWRGLSGGTEVWKRIQSFFTELRERAAPVGAHQEKVADHA